jgi:uncharacterized cysteine cluster protein YcgN (CxxCxxCC family)
MKMYDYVKVTETNTEKTKYMLLSRHQHAGKSHNIKIKNRTFENVHSSDIWERLQQIKT